MLERTVDRASELIDKDRIITVVGEHHSPYVDHQDFTGRIIVQPESRGTAAGVLLPVTHVMASEPDATVLIFPSDHFIHPEGRFLELVSQARLLAERLEDKVILLGAVPDDLEVDYGWIKPAERFERGGRSDSPASFKVAGFLEKPDAATALRLQDNGCLNNTFIIASTVRTLWSLGAQFIPGVVNVLDVFRKVLNGRKKGIPDRKKERETLRRLYRFVPRRNFSRALLTPAATECVVVPLEGVFWSDWGRPERVRRTFEATGLKPSFTVFG
jgi:mannose-1-phosphate guanylyltransferase